MYERVTVQPVSKADFLFTRVTSRDVMRIRMHMTCTCTCTCTCACRVWRQLKHKVSFLSAFVLDRGICEKTKVWTDQGARLKYRIRTVWSMGTLSR